jgi:hypothetical protein
MKQKQDLQLFDKRTIDRMIERGLLTEKEYKAFLQSLPDKQDNAETVRVEQGKEDGNT